MLIPFLSLDPTKVPPLLPDAHVIKLIAESFQIVCTAARKLELPVPNEADLIRSSHEHHPYTRWAAQSVVHVMYTLRLALALCEEKRARWPDNAPHCYEERCQRVLAALPADTRYVLLPHEVPPVCMGLLGEAEQAEVRDVVATRGPIAGFAVYFRLAKRPNAALWHFCGGRIKALGCHKRVGKKAAPGHKEFRCVVNEPAFWLGVE